MYARSRCRLSRRLIFNCFSKKNFERRRARLLRERRKMNLRWKKEENRRYRDNEWRKSLLERAGGKKLRRRVRFHRKVATFLLLLPPAPRTTQLLAAIKKKTRADRHAWKIWGLLFRWKSVIAGYRGVKYLENYGGNFPSFVWKVRSV